MNKNELIRAIAQDAGLKNTEATKALDALITVIGNTLKSGDDIRLVGFGSFLVTERKASTGRNPRTGEPIKIAATKVPKFRAGKGLKEKVNIPASKKK